MLKFTKSLTIAAALIATSTEAVKLQQDYERAFNTMLKDCDFNDNDAITWAEAYACGAPLDWKPSYLAMSDNDEHGVTREEFLAGAAAFNAV